MVIKYEHKVVYAWLPWPGHGSVAEREVPHPKSRKDDNNIHEWELVEVKVSGSDGTAILASHWRRQIPT